MRKKCFLIFSLTLIILNQQTRVVFAESTSGYAWNENTGWIDFSKVTVGIDGLSGFAYSSNIGWLSMNCDNTNSCGTTNYKVVNNSGSLSGFAWNENTGFIDFGKVIIDTSNGIFSGYAYSPNIGWFSMNCNTTTSCGVIDYKVTTAWRLNIPTVTGSGHGGGQIIITECNDNKDNDGDGLIDSADPDCRIAGPRISESSPPVNTPFITQDSHAASPLLKTCSVRLIRTLKFKTPLIYGDDIKALQTCLNERNGPQKATIVPDGLFGKRTKAAVLNFQKENNIKATGVVGPVTRSKLK